MDDYEKAMYAALIGDLDHVSLTFQVMALILLAIIPTLDVTSVW